MNQCQELKAEYQVLEDLKAEFDLAYQEALATGDLARVRELKAELEQKRDVLQEKLRAILSPEMVKRSIERIKKELGLDIRFKVENDRAVEFQEAKEKIDQIIQIITHKKNEVTRLNLWGNHLDLEDARAIAEALASPDSKLTGLDLNHNNLGLEGARVIAEALTSPNNKLTELCLWSNSLGLEGAKVIAEALTSPNNKLTELDLGYNNLGLEGAKAIAEALTSPNNKLTELCLGYNNLGPEDKREIEERVKAINPNIKLIV